VIGVPSIGATAALSDRSNRNSSVLAVSAAVVTVWMLGVGAV